MENNKKEYPDVFPISESVKLITDQSTYRVYYAGIDPYTSSNSSFVDCPVVCSQCKTLSPE